MHISDNRRRIPMMDEKVLLATAGGRARAARLWDRLIALGHWFAAGVMRISARAYLQSALAAALVFLTTAQALEKAEDVGDAYLWLEEIEDEKALDWVRARNAETASRLTKDPLFETLYAEALSILASEARIPYGSIHQGQVYNFWQDDNHKRGLWRRAPIDSYRQGAPAWETVLDFDALAKAEGRNWVRGDVVCLTPAYRRCMVELSDGGSDTALWREFDIETKAFVEGGYVLPEGKSLVSWFDEDLLLVAAKVEDDDLTTSGYPRVVRAWSRGQALDAAPVIFRGEETDVRAQPMVARDGGRTHIFLRRSPSFFESIYRYAEGDGAPRTLPTPPNTNFHGVLDGRAILFLREDWDYGGRIYAAGSAVAYDLDDETVMTLMAANDTQSIEQIEIADTAIFIQYLDNVTGRLARIDYRDDGVAHGYVAHDIPFPENGVVSIVSVSDENNEALVSFESMTTPDALYFVDGEGTVELIMQTPPLYDGDDVVVEQRFAMSADGVRAPYFVMGAADVLAKGDAPTIQYGYGGFLAAILPSYYSDPGRPQHGALAGKMWIARGGVLVLSNIRGGSEYGPRWHMAALKENRQRAFDDFIAISQDLIATGVTTPQKLGAIGRSNGGLLMGAVMTQRPDLYAAYDIGVPLFDMKRYNKLLAGASWMGEYGDPDKADDWAYIGAYSPYQKLTAGAGYAAPLFYTSTKDDRVHPGHARKAAAKMIDLGYDVFYYENIEGGHGGAANQEQLAYRTALEYRYFIHQLMDAASVAGESTEQQ